MRQRFLKGGHAHDHGSIQIYRATIFELQLQCESQRGLISASGLVAGEANFCAICDSTLTTTLTEESLGTVMIWTTMAFHVQNTLIPLTPATNSVQTTESEFR